MKRHSLLTTGIGIFCLCICTLFSKAQNLVLNPSFEITSSNCGNFGGEGFTTDAVNWDDANSGADSCSSPDLFSACNIIFGFPSVTYMPTSALGYQYSRTGTRHAGIITYAPGIASGCTAIGNDNYREYIEGRTSTPLVAGQVYCVSMYVSLANNVAWASNNIGIYFSNTLFQRNPCGSNNSVITTVSPQLNYTCTPLTDTVNWVRLQWNYTATGGEQYFVIGNFFNNAATAIGCNNSAAGFQNPYAYYFIDDVSIVPNTCCYADISKPGILCSNSPLSTTLTANPGLSAACTQTVNGTWSGTGITNSSTGVFSPSVAGPGTHVVSFSLSCGYTATTAINVSPCNLAVCHTGSLLTVSGGTSPYTWQAQTTYTDCSGCPFGFCNPLCPGVVVTTWTTVATNTPTYNATSFPIRVMDNAGSTFTVSNLTSIPTCTTTASCPTLTLSVLSQANVSCFGANTGSATVGANGGSTPYTYTWTPGTLTGASQSSLSAGTYTVYITDQAGCPGAGTVSITQPGSALSSSLTGTTSATCGMSNGSATISASGGTPGYTYSWTPGGGSAASSNMLSAGNYAVVVKDSKGCSSTTTLTINSANGPTLSVTSQANVRCFGTNTGTASVSNTGGTLPYTYTWMPGSLSGPTQTSLSAGTYTILTQDAGGCTATGIVIITQPPALSLSVSATVPSACGGSTGAATVAANGGTAGYTYSWSPTGGTAATATNLAAGLYTITTSDSKSCTASVTAMINSANGPTVSVSAQANVSCFGANTGSASVSVSGGSGTYTYSWSPGSSTTASAGSLSAGTYTVRVSDGSCASTTVVTITQPQAMTGSVTTNAAGCAGSTGSASVAVSGGSGAYTYSWSNGATTSTISQLAPGTYSVVIRDAASCTHTISGLVNSTTGSFPLDAGATATIQPGGSTVLNGQSSQATSYTWTPAEGLSCTNCLNPIAGPSQTTTYTLMATNGSDCVAADTVTVFVELPCGDLYIPSAFSPNNDGQNDVLKIYGNCITELEFAIYDRWGEKVFETNDPSLTWDGTFKGKLMDPAVFAYYFKAIVNGNKIQQNGSISIVR